MFPLKGGTEVLGNSYVESMNLMGHSMCVFYCLNEDNGLSIYRYNYVLSIHIIHIMPMCVNIYIYIYTHVAYMHAFIHLYIHRYKDG